ncbi:hypothetical protein BDU57DRAFT_554248 [Ampelomyces quisqualis]|uniref:Chitin-binding type-4 domain-containing protein n=1 Tax=Ampelomyces quisqualis TaxID=50730 RepID=A0A6A5QTR3_AMPQU|nr:hypothetical protein BDU57DRAFT_554248 [Ampelomyces quisqualis]
MFSKIIAAWALAASASAHMIMTNPIPFTSSGQDKGPIDLAGYPCKKQMGFAFSEDANKWIAGEKQVITFDGTATHGGGSAQISLTTDTEPTEKSQFKVIHSFIGNFPTDRPGNLMGADADKKPGQYPFTVPNVNGTFTVAVSWINKVGNREFYMMCAHVTISSGTSSDSTASAQQNLADLPDMFVANLPADECSTKEGEDFQYPNPGQSVTIGKSVNLGSTLTGSGCAKQNAMGAGAGSIGSPSAGTPSTPSQGTPSTPSQSTPSIPSGVQSPAGPNPTSNPGGAFAPGASATPATPSSVAQPVAPAKGLTAPVANSPPATPQQLSNTTPSNGQCIPCTQEGAKVCMDERTYGLCNHGCAIPQPMAPGATCTSTKKRHIHFPRAHLHRSLSAAHLI